MSDEFLLGVVQLIIYEMSRVLLNFTGLEKLLGLVIQNGQIPVNKKGKKYNFFKDDIIKWLESGCKTEAPMNPDEINQLLRQRPNRNC